MGKKCSKRKLGGLVEICWIDAKSAGGGWTHPDDFSYTTHILGAINVSLGYFIKEEAGQIFIAQSLNPGSGTYAECLSIPMGCVKKIRRVK